MREWTEKHIIELIKKNSGGGIITPFYTDIWTYGFAYESGFVTFSNFNGIKYISPIAKKILHLDDSKWKSSHVLKSTLDSTWDTSERRIIEVEANNTACSNSEEPFLFRCFLVPSPDSDVNPYNTYTQIKVHIDSPAVALADVSPFLNFPLFQLQSGSQTNVYSINSTFMVDLNAVLREKLTDGEDVFTTSYNISKDVTIEKGKWKYSNWEYTYTPSDPESFIFKSGFLKYFDAVKSNDMYIEILNDDVIVRPDEEAKENRIFYGSAIAEAYENPD